MQQLSMGYQSCWPCGPWCPCDNEDDGAGDKKEEKEENEAMKKKKMEVMAMITHLFTTL